MVSGLCYKKGKERGAWFELRSLRENIAGIEARGGDATFERSLYEEWLKFPEFEKADKYNRGEGFYSELSIAPPSRRCDAKIENHTFPLPPNYATVQTPLFSPGDSISPRPRGRPIKQGEVHRVTAWRRLKEHQATENGRLGMGQREAIHQGLSTKAEIQ